MQDAATGQKSSKKFELPISSELKPAPSRFFEIVPESVTQREKSFAQFALEDSVSGVSTNNDKAIGPDSSKNSKASVAELLVNAETLISHGEKDLARVLIYEALKVDSKNPLALKKAKQFLNPKSDLVKLVTIQTQICKSEMSYENFADLAQLHYKMGNDELALKCFHEALNLVVVEDDSLFEVYKNMGNIMTRAGDFEGAEESFHKAFTIKPDSDILSVNLGTLAIQRNDYHSALERFRQAVTKNPKNDTAWVGLSLVHQEMGDVQLAFANIETALDLNPKNRTAVHLFANWCLRESRFQNAIEVVESYLSSVDVDEEISLVLIHLFCKILRYDLAKLEAERVLLWNPSHVQTLEIHKELSTILNRNPQ